MRINPGQLQHVLGVYAKQSRKAEPATGGPNAPQDEVSLSEHAEEIFKARQAYDAAPAVREDRVAAIRAGLKDGTYRLTDTDIAAAILRGTPDAEKE